jgi:hypothetical protein
VRLFSGSSSSPQYLSISLVGADRLR